MIPFELFHFRLQTNSIPWLCWMRTCMLEMSFLKPHSNVVFQANRQLATQVCRKQNRLVLWGEYRHHIHSSLWLIHLCHRERSLIIKRDLILKILRSSGSLTEREILKQIGDNRYSREIVRKLLQDGLIYRVGKVGTYLGFWSRSSSYFAGRCKRSVQIRCCWTLPWSRQGAEISTLLGTIAKRRFTTRYCRG